LTVRGEKNAAERKKLIWVSFLILDVLLHKTSRIEILEHLFERGYTVFLIAPRSRRKYQPENSHIHIISIPIRYVPIISPLLFVATLLFLLPYYILSVKPDFIVTEPDISILGLIWTPLLARLRSFKVVLDIRSTPVETEGVGGYLTRNLIFNASILVAKKFFDGITIITALMKKEVCNKYRVNPKLVGVWTSGVSPTLFDPQKYMNARIALRNRMGLDGKFVVLYHGNFGVKRGIVECVKSIEMLGSKSQGLVLFLLGSGHVLPEIERITVSRGLKDRVIIHPPVEYRDVPSYIAMCDLGIIPLPDLPDWRNQCPLKLLEYLSMEKVVILTDIQAHREVVGDSNCGIYIRSSDPAEIAGAINYAFDNQEKLKKFGYDGREIISRKYTWNKVAEDFDRYLSAVKKGFNKE
jgi:glycosyltransferase involved in cell wall biosynthesis